MKTIFIIFLTMFGYIYSSHAQELTALSGSQVCSFIVGDGSPNSGPYIVTAQEGDAFAFHDFENEQYVFEIRGDNYIDMMLILENLTEGKHPFTMEMQVSINISKNEGDDYFSFENHQEEGGGFIRIDKIDKNSGIITGSFEGLFNDSLKGDDKPIQLNGIFSVIQEKR